LIKETEKMIRAATPISNNLGEYSVRKNPARIANSRNVITRINDLTIHLKPIHPALGSLKIFSFCKPETYKKK
jgi:hypothetical protein